MHIPVSVLRVLSILSVLALLLALAQAPAVQVRVEERPRAVVRTFRNPEPALRRLFWRGTATGLAWTREMVWPIGIADVIRAPCSLTTLLLRVLVGGAILFYVAFAVAVYKRWLSSEDDNVFLARYDERELL